MVVLLTGATGFIGRHLAAALERRGHTVIAAVRHPQPDAHAVQADFTRDTDERTWLPRLQGVDVVINAVGILRERGAQTFERIHTQTPQALFAACIVSGVRRVIQISALGAEQGGSGYFDSKRRADDFLASLPLGWTIVQPSLVYGPGGQSTHLFTMLASLPWIPLPGSGRQAVQPIHVDDLTQAIVRLCEEPQWMQRRVPLVGRAPMMFREFLLRLRAALGLPGARCLVVPRIMMHMAALAGELTGRGLLDRDALRMLERGNTADAGATRQLLEREPRDIEDFVAPDARSMIVAAAQLAWLSPLLRFSLALVWLWSGVVSLGLYPREASYELLAQVGVSGAVLAPLMLYGAAALDMAFGLATLWMRRRRWLWRAQFAVILVYTLILSIALPEFWLHPFGPLVKNLPMLAVIYALYVLERPAWNT